MFEFTPGYSQVVIPLCQSSSPAILRLSFLCVKVHPRLYLNQYILLRINPVLHSFITYHRVYDNSDTLGVTCGAETACHSSVSEFTPGNSQVVIPLCPSSPPTSVRLSFLCVRVHPRYSKVVIPLCQSSPPAIVRLSFFCVRVHPRLKSGYHSSVLKITPSYSQVYIAR